MEVSLAKCQVAKCRSLSAGRQSASCGLPNIKVQATVCQMAKCKRLSNRQVAVCRIAKCRLPGVRWCSASSEMQVANQC